jgi:hypothetical protein
MSRRTAIIMVFVINCNGLRVAFGNPRQIEGSVNRSTRRPKILIDTAIPSMLKIVYGFICIRNEYDVQRLVVG